MISVYHRDNDGEIQSKNLLVQRGIFCKTLLQTSKKSGVSFQGLCVFLDCDIRWGYCYFTLATTALQWCIILCRVTLVSEGHLESQDLQGKLYVSTSQHLYGPAFHNQSLKFIPPALNSLLPVNRRGVLTTSIGLFPLPFSLQLEQRYFTWPRPHDVFPSVVPHARISSPHFHCSLFFAALPWASAAVGILRASVVFLGRRVLRRNQQALSWAFTLWAWSIPKCPQLARTLATSRNGCVLKMQSSSFCRALGWNVEHGICMLTCGQTPVPSLLCPNVRPELHLQHYGLSIRAFST